MKYLFEPASIAVIGASSDPEKIGYKIVENVVQGGYKGKVIPVNPKGGTILGLAVCRSLQEVGHPVDVAVMCILAALVQEESKKAVDAGAKYLVIITSGFSETGNGAEEKKIIEYAKSHGTRVLGPNIFGIYSSSVDMNATFGPSDIKKGNVAIVTQSGAIGIAMIGKTKAENIGLSAIVSVGNKADIDEADILEYLIGHEQTKIILMYIEGVQNGEKLVRAMKAATKLKPVIVIKSGRSKRGAIAAASHTGSLSGADTIFDDIARQCGVIRAESLGDAMDWCFFFEKSHLPQNESSCIITNGGGIGVLAADACEKFGVALYDDQAALKASFASVMPDFGSAKNPVDITGEADEADYNKALTVAMNDEHIGSVICLGCETAIFNADKFSQMVKKQFDAYKAVKPVVFSIFGGKETEQSIGVLKNDGVPIFGDVYEAVSCMGALNRQWNNSKRKDEPPAEVNIDAYAIAEVIKSVRKEGRTFLLADESRKVMSAAGMIVPKSRIASTLADAVKAAEEIGYPVVMKIVSKDIIHKSDAGGVALDLQNRQEVMEAYESIILHCRAYKKDAVISGVEIAEMLGKGVETIIGARRDRSFGPLVMFGLGGIYVEVMKDVAFRAFPISRGEAFGMMSQIRSYPLLLGVRGEGMKDMDSAADAILKTGAILNACKDISDIEINPLIVYEQGEGAKAVDARILLSATAEVV